MRLAGLVLLMIASAVSTGASAQKYRDSSTTAIEIAQLPPYCYPQYVDEKLAANPQYAMPRGCGAFMNHLCPAHLLFIRAKNVAASRNQRKQNLERAIREYRYTLKNMEPACPLRQDVEASLRTAQAYRSNIP